LIAECNTAAVPRLTVTRAAQKQLAGVPSKARTVIAGKIEQLAADPRALANVVERLRGSTRAEPADRRLAGALCRAGRRDRGPRGGASPRSLSIEENMPVGKTAAERSFTAPDGTLMAVLPMAELERLRDAAEGAGLARIAAEAERRLASGADELIPWEMSKRLLAGENAVRVWRERRGLTVEKLAEAAGISQPYLSQIEIGRRDGTFKVMAALARALGVGLDDLAPPAGEKPVSVRKRRAR
jgi:DNA-binding XRE family transcriptional regulator